LSTDRANYFGAAPDGMERTFELSHAHISGFARGTSFRFFEVQAFAGADASAIEINRDREGWPARRATSVCVPTEGAFFSEVPAL
jgi:hypothetical protein